MERVVTPHTVAVQLGKERRMGSELVLQRAFDWLSGMEEVLAVAQ